MITIDKLVKWYGIENVLITSDHGSPPWKAVTVLFGNELTGTGDTLQKALKDLDEALLKWRGKRYREWVATLNIFVHDPLWSVLCWVFGVHYGDWCFECMDLVQQSGRNLEDALYVCGYKSVFQLRWKMLLSMIPKEGDNA